MKEYLPTDDCKKCGGQCCKSLPAPYIPKDILKIFGDVQTAINSGLVAIDRWEANIPMYFIRPKTKGVDRLYDFSWGGECIHLTDKGCSLPREKMPFFCKTVEPQSNFECNDHLSKYNSKYWAGVLWKRSRINLQNLEKGV